MSVLPDWMIREIRPVEPFAERTVFKGKTYGLSTSGYDVRIAESIWVFPGWGRLASTIERFKMPNDVCARVHDKSSWARKIVALQTTFIEAGWEGYLTLEITRHKPWPIFIEAGTPIAQIVFEKLEAHPEMPYNGKYQNQKAGPQPAIYEKEKPK